ncbi:hypothetical protein H8K35_05030 [Undibacterium sp. LX40W]|uniref:Molecular chaperone DnaJ n=1 Tax=Undibacterium nitidum TaxID=2762298 RepID=A0A923HLZ6_9BURK|nr:MULTISPECIES: hypothetical protein [Undibacterium]MBC3880251.1 hypothetical protein [Undibacterium nitidum]MBC3891013.1 hypothetical protein [Undibacterium sp. LX40W]
MSKEQKCPECKGKGVIPCPVEYGGEEHDEGCPVCRGDRSTRVTCPDCEGKGKMNPDMH